MVNSLVNKLLPNLNEVSKPGAIHSVSSADQSLWLELHSLKETEAASDKLLLGEFRIRWRRHGAWLPIIYS